MKFAIYHIALFFMLIVHHLPAQVKSNNGRFEVDFARGCDDLTVTATNLYTYTGSKPSIQYDFEADGTTTDFTNDTIYTYTDPGEYYIVQVIGTASIKDTLKIVVSPPEEPEFVIQPCENHRAKVEVQPGQYDSLRVFYTSGDSIDIAANEQAPIFPYTSGWHTITVEGLVANGKDNCGISTKTFRTIDALVPANLNVVEVVTVDEQSGEISLEYELEPHVLYKLEMATNNTSNFTFLQYLKSPSQNILIDSLDTQNNFYCFRITAHDACDNKDVFSNLICSTVLNVTAQNNQNQVVWETSINNFDRFELIKNNNQNFNIGDINQRSFGDNDVVCNESYCYQLISHYANGSQSRSAVRCDTAFTTYTPDPIQNITASVNDSGVEFSWKAPDSINVKNYIIYRSTNNGAFEEIGAITSNSFQDIVNISGTNQFCYQLRYEDNCGNISEESTTTCPVYLSKSYDNNLEKLSWTEYKGWESGVKTYVVEKLDQAGNVIETIDLGLLNSYQETSISEDNQTIIYQVKAVSGDSSFVSISNQVKIVYLASAFFPNAFTPDGDGINDIFQVKGRFIGELDLKVFNRWGELIFHTDQLDVGWDGNYLGKQVAEDIYIYTATITDNEGNSFKRKGTIYLIRK